MPPTQETQQITLSISQIEKFLKANEDNVLDGRLNMKQQRMINLADPVDNYDAVTKRYVSSRIQARYVSSRIQALADAGVELRGRIERLERLIQK